LRASAEKLQTLFFLFFDGKRAGRSPFRATKRARTSLGAASLTERSSCEVRFRPCESNFASRATVAPVVHRTSAPALPEVTTATFKSLQEPSDIFSSYVIRREIGRVPEELALSLQYLDSSNFFFHWSKPKKEPSCREVPSAGICPFIPYNAGLNYLPVASRRSARRFEEGSKDTQVRQERWRRGLLEDGHSVVEIRAGSLTLGCPILSKGGFSSASMHA
jgi:hypothetical protein